jgi:flavin reductase (DIM6/NTAB) family NADH-FMN oxidoreductase RutF
MKIDPAKLDPKVRYNLLIGSILPRPIAVVGTYGPGNVANVAPFSFFNAVSADPMLVMLGIANNAQGEPKDSLRNLLAVSEGGRGGFTISIAHREILGQVVSCAEALPPEESEFELSGLTPIRAELVDAPRVAEARITLECKTHSITRFKPGVPGAGNLILGEIVLIHVADSLANDRLHIDPAELDAVGRLGGFGYCSIRERTNVPPGREALLSDIHWR